MNEETRSADGPQKVTVERIEAAVDSLRVAGNNEELKNLLADLDYYTHWVHEQTHRNKAVIKKILEHTDFHGEAPPTL